MTETELLGLEVSVRALVRPSAKRSAETMDMGTALEADLRKEVVQRGTREHTAALRRRRENETRAIAEDARLERTPRAGEESS